MSELQGSDGPPMVLIHGFGGNADHWRKNMPNLAKAGPVYAIDLLGKNNCGKLNAYPTRILKVRSVRGAVLITMRCCSTTYGRGSPQ